MNKTMVLGIKIPDGDYERREFYLNDECVASVNHDTHGWSGMEAVECAMKEVARVLGIEVVELPEEEESEAPK